MATSNIPPTVDQTDIDFNSLYTRLFNLLASVFPDWTSENPGDWGNVLVGFYAFVGDVLGYYINNYGREAHIATASQYSSMLYLSKLLNYSPATAAAATADVVMTLAEVPTNDVVFPAGTTKVRTLDVTGAVEFQLLSETTIPALSDPPEVTAGFEHSTSHQETFASTGVPLQTIRFGSTPYIGDSAEIEAANGIYTVVDNFLESGPTDRHVVVFSDHNNYGYARFGTGVNGEKPQGTITVDYKTGGGEDGNVAANTLTRIIGSYTDVLSNPVDVSVNNPAKASGGSDRESVEEIRLNAPASLRVLNRTVANEDYEINAKRVSGIERSLMLTSNEDVRIAENSGRLIIIPTGGGQPTSIQRAAVLVMVTETYPNTITFDVTVDGAVFLTINVEARVYVRTGYLGATVAANILAMLTAYFALTNEDGTENTNVLFGSQYAEQSDTGEAAIPYSDIYNAVRDADGVYKVLDSPSAVLVNGEFSDVTLEADEFPELGTVTVIDAASGAEIS